MSCKQNLIREPACQNIHEKICSFVKSISRGKRVSDRFNTEDSGSIFLPYFCSLFGSYFFTWLGPIHKCENWSPSPVKNERRGQSAAEKTNEEKIFYDFHFPMDKILQSFPKVLVICRCTDKISPPKYPRRNIPSGNIPNQNISSKNIPSTKISLLQKCPHYRNVPSKNIPSKNVPSAKISPGQKCPLCKNIPSAKISPVQKCPQFKNVPMAKISPLQ